MNVLLSGIFNTKFVTNWDFTSPPEIMFGGKFSGKQNLLKILICVTSEFTDLTLEIKKDHLYFFTSCV